MGACKSGFMDCLEMIFFIIFWGPLNYGKLKGRQEEGTPEQFSVSCKLGYFGIGKILFNKLTAYFGFAWQLFILLPQK